MAKKIISLGNIGKGITPNISDKVSDGWKQLNNVERDDLLGAVKCRDGLRTTALYTGGTAPGTVEVREVIAPSINYNVSFNSVALYYYADWLTYTPTLGFNYIPKKKYYLNSMILSNFFATSNWASNNPNSKMTFTLRKATIETVKTYVSGTSGAYYYRYVWTLTDTLGTATVNIGTLGTAETAYTFNFGTNIPLEIGQQYFMQLSFSDLDVAMSETLTVYYKGTTTEYNNFMSLLLENWEEKINPYTFQGLNVSFNSNAVLSGAIDNLVYAEQYRDMLIAVTNETNRGIINVSENKTTLKDIIPTDMEAPDERYGVSVLYKNNAFFMTFLSSLMQKSYDTNNILYYRAGNLKAVLIEQIKETITTAQVASAQPPLIYQYGIQYVFSDFESEIFDVVDNIDNDLVTYSDNRIGANTTWRTDPGASPPPFNAPTIKLTIPIKNLVTTTALPTEIRVFRKAIKHYNFQPPYGDTTEFMNSQPYQLINTYPIPDYDNNSLVPDTWEWTDNVRRVESGDVFIAPDIIFEPATGIRVYPSPSFIFDYNSRTFALGDKFNRDVVYFSKDSAVDFYADNAFSLQLPKEDYFLSAGFELGESAFISSPHCLWRVTEVSTEMPYYRIEKVRGLENIGIIAPKTIVQAQGMTYFLSEEGFMKFDTANATVISLEINNYIKDINKDYLDKNGNVVNPAESDCYYAPYLAEAVYDDNKNVIYLAIPYGNTIINNIAFKYNLITKSWETISIDDFRGFVMGRINGVTARTDDLLIDISDTGKIDTYKGIEEVITATLETNDTVLPDNVKVSRMTIYGQGNINLYIYTNRSTTPRITKTNIALSLDGTDIVINLSPFEFRYKIEGISADFMLTVSPKITLTGSGLKHRGDVK